MRTESTEAAIGQDSEFAALFASLDRPSDAVSVDGGYAELMACLTSQTYRKRHALN